MSGRKKAKSLVARKEAPQPAAAPITEELESVHGIRGVPGPVAKCPAFLVRVRIGSTTVTPIMGSSPFRCLAISARHAQGQASER